MLEGLKYLFLIENSKVKMTSSKRFNNFLNNQNDINSWMYTKQRDYYILLSRKVRQKYYENFNEMFVTEAFLENCKTFSLRQDENDKLKMMN